MCASAFVICAHPILCGPAGLPPARVPARAPAWPNLGFFCCLDRVRPLFRFHGCAPATRFFFLFFGVPLPLPVLLLV